MQRIVYNLAILLVWKLEGVDPLGTDLFFANFTTDQNLPILDPHLKFT